VYGSETSTTPCGFVGTAMTLDDTEPTPKDKDPVLILGTTGALELSDVTDAGWYTVKLHVD
jgi:hypothetical protein